MNAIDYIMIFFQSFNNISENLSIPPDEYTLKSETQDNRRLQEYAVDCVF